jgi:hypothetical protein
MNSNCNCIAGLSDELEPLLRRIIREELVNTSIVRGVKNIKKLLGVRKTETVMKYYKEYGLPMVKGMRGHWEIHSGSIKDWMNTRSIIARKAMEMGFMKDHSQARYPRIEKLTDAQMGRIMARIREEHYEQ